MLEKPPLDERALLARLERDYGTLFSGLEFLPLGADRNTAVYRAVGADGTPYFLKLRLGGFDEASVRLPRFFGASGVEHIILPVATKTGELWTTLDAYTVILYPFVTGQDGYKVPLTEANWRDFGRTLRRLHTLEVPEALTREVRRETFAADSREAVKDLLEQLGTQTFEDDAGIKMSRFILEHQREILDLVGQAERYAHVLKRKGLEPVLCHDDLHAGNLLICENQTFYIVDWDDPILAPKERDLMFIGGGLGFKGFTPQREETLFYEGYGQTDIDPSAVAYYRLERILRDIESYGSELVHGVGSQEERELSLHYLRRNFEPGGTIERAYAVATTA